MVDKNTSSPLVVGGISDAREPVSGRLLSSGPELSAFRLRPETLFCPLRYITLFNKLVLTNITHLGEIGRLSRYLPQFWPGRFHPVPPCLAPPTEPLSRVLETSSSFEDAQ